VPDIGPRSPATRLQHLNVRIFGQGREECAYFLGVAENLGEFDLIIRRDVLIAEKQYLVFKESFP
jgi:hypothetical protein